jgi:hypothetical protein
MKEKIKSEKWEDKLISLIEKETELATGNKSREHFSGDCKMNEILEFVRNREKAAREEVIEQIKKLPIYMKVVGNDLSEPKEALLKDDVLQILTQ